MNLVIDQGLATVLIALFVAISSMWQSYMLNKVHTLTNSNFSEAKAARVIAENALKTAEMLNVSLQRQLDIKAATAPVSPQVS